MTDSLRPFLPPTDSRLRPDQRAFEEGRYDHAQELKALQEDLQRATRRRRELGEIAQHSPRWFTEAVDGATQERVWKPKRDSDGEIEYWALRKAIGTAKLNKKDMDWPQVEPIFTDHT